MTSWMWRHEHFTSSAHVLWKPLGLHRTGILTIYQGMIFVVLRIIGDRNRWSPISTQRWNSFLSSFLFLASPVNCGFYDECEHHQRLLRCDRGLFPITGVFYRVIDNCPRLLRIFAMWSAIDLDCWALTINMDYYDNKFHWIPWLKLQNSQGCSYRNFFENNF